MSMFHDIAQRSTHTCKDDTHALCSLVHAMMARSSRTRIVELSVVWGQRGIAAVWLALQSITSLLCTHSTIDASQVAVHT